MKLTKLFVMIVLTMISVTPALGNTPDEVVTAEDEVTVLSTLPSPELKEGVYINPKDQENVLEARARRRSAPVKRASDWGDAPACNNIYSTVLSAVGDNRNRASCYMGLFFMETTCEPTTSQAAGNVGNAHAAYGLCSLEKSAGVRSDNHRGPDCKDISSVTKQVKCCRAIMRRSPRYFGPFRRGEVAQCG